MRVLRKILLGLGLIGGPAFAQDTFLDAQVIDNGTLTVQDLGVLKVESHVGNGDSGRILFINNDGGEEFEIYQNGPDVVFDGMLTFETDNQRILGPDDEIVIDITNDRVGIGGIPASPYGLDVYGQTRLRAATAFGGHIVPTTNGAFDLGSSSFRLRNIYADTFTGPLVGELDPDNLTGDSVDNNLVDAALIQAGLTDAQVVDGLTISGGTVNGSVIGGVTPAAITGTTLTALGNSTLGTASAEDFVNLFAYTNARGPINFPATGGNVADGQWGAMPLLFGFPLDGSLGYGNGAPIFVNADAYTVNGNPRTFVWDLWSATNDTALLLENTSETWGVGIGIEDRLYLGVDGASSVPFIALRTGLGSPAEAHSSNSGSNDFDVSALGPDFYLDIKTNWTAAAGVRIRPSALGGLVTNPGFPEIEAYGDAISGYDGPSATDLGHSTPPAENPSGAFIARGFDRHAPPSGDTSWLDETYDDYGGSVVLEGTQGQASVVLMQFQDALNIYASPEDYDRPSFADLILSVDQSSGEAKLFYGLTVVGATAMNGGVTIGDNAGDAFTINPGSITMDNYDWVDAQVADALTVSGGTVNNSVIGGTTPVAGTFTTLTATDDFWHDMAAVPYGFPEWTLTAVTNAMATTWAPDSAELYLENLQAGGVLYFPLRDTTPGTTIVQLRAKVYLAADMVGTALNLTLQRRDESSAAASSFTDVVTVSLIPNNPDTIEIVTQNIADHTVLADNSYRLAVTYGVGDDSGARIYSIGYQTGARVN